MPEPRFLFGFAAVACETHCCNAAGINDVRPLDMPLRQCIISRE
jgi:hypothetical protein